MAVAISTLLPFARAQLPGIPEPILTDSLYRKIREFFWRSEAWKYTYDNGKDWTLNTLAVPAPVAGTDIPDKTIVKRVDTINYDAGGNAWDQIIPFKTRDELDRKCPDWRTRTGSTPSYWTYDNSVGAVITPQATATVTTGLLIRSVIAPVFTALTDELPDSLYYEFEGTMRAGVITELAAMPDKDWSNAGLAQYYMGMWESGITEAKSRAEADYGQPSDVMSYGGL